MIKATIKNIESSETKTATGDAVLMAVCDGEEMKLGVAGAFDEKKLSAMLAHVIDESVRVIVKDPEEKKRIYMRVASAVKEDIKRTNILINCQNDAEEITWRLLNAIFGAAEEEK